MAKKFSVGIVAQDRWDFTEATLSSIYYSDQPKETFDVYLIDNGSNSDTKASILKYAKSGLLNIKNILTLEKQTSISKAWNLFLALSKDYEYRLKMDNDVVLHNVLVPGGQKVVKRNPNASTPQEADSSSGAPKSVSVVTGVGAGRGTKKQRDFLKSLPSHSCFLELMQEFGSNNNADLVSLVPVTPGEPFAKMHQAVLSAKKNQMPFLFGACMLISKKVFDVLGYFDERLPRRIDVEYSQRALRNKFNIGYHPFYGVSHIGARNPTEPPNLLQQKHTDANMIESQKPPIKDFAPSVWTNHIDKIISKCSKSKIIKLG